MANLSRRNALAVFASAASFFNPISSKADEPDQSPVLAALVGFDCSNKTLTKGGAITEEGLTYTDVLRASAALASTPLYCGRYFSGTDSESTLCQSHDLSVLERFEIPMLLIARQTTSVIKASSSLGSQHARMNVSEFLRIFQGAPHGPSIIKQLQEDQATSSAYALRFYLDVENDHPLNADYYSGWVEGLRDASIQSGIQFIPAVYASADDQHTLDVLDRAVDDDSKNCSGLWIAKSNFGQRARALGCRTVSLGVAEPIRLSTKVPIWLYQYAECDERIDISYLSDPHQDRAISFFHSLVRTWVLKPPKKV